MTVYNTVYTTSCFTLLIKACQTGPVQSLPLTKCIQLSLLQHRLHSFLTSKASIERSSMQFNPDQLYNIRGCIHGFGNACL